MLDLTKFDNATKELCFFDASGGGVIKRKVDNFELGYIFRGIPDSTGHLFAAAPELLAEVKELQAEVDDLMHVLSSIVGCAMSDDPGHSLEEIDGLVCGTLEKYVRPPDTLPLEADNAGE